MLFNVGRWYKQHGADRIKAARQAVIARLTFRVPGMIAAIAVLMALIFSKQIYFAAIASYYTFYLIERFRRCRFRQRSSTCSSSWHPSPSARSWAVSWATDSAASA